MIWTDEFKWIPVSELPGMVILGHPSKYMPPTHTPHPPIIRLNTILTSLIHPPTPGLSAYSFAETPVPMNLPYSSNQELSTNALLLAFLGCWVTHVGLSGKGCFPPAPHRIWRMRGSPGKNSQNCSCCLRPCLLHSKISHLMFTLLWICDTLYFHVTIIQYFPSHLLEFIEKLNNSIFFLQLSSWASLESMWITQKVRLNSLTSSN